MKSIHRINSALVLSFILGGIAIVLLAAYNNQIPLDTSPEHLKRLFLPFLVGSVSASLATYLVQSKHRALRRQLVEEQDKRAKLETELDEQTHHLCRSEKTLNRFFEQPINVHLIAKLDGTILKVLGPLDIASEIYCPAASREFRPSG